MEKADHLYLTYMPLIMWYSLITYEVNWNFEENLSLLRFTIYVVKYFTGWMNIAGIFVFDH